MKYGLIGEKLSHSFSKEIHSALADYEYEIREIPKDELSSFILKKEFNAINVTIPYKEAVMPHLDVISDEAKAIGSVNTVVNRSGMLYGYNTDFFGMKSLIEHAGISVAGKKAAILGSGGTARTARAVLAHLGASEILTVGRASRDGVIDYATLYKEHHDTELIINTTPVGMYPNNDAYPIELSEFRKLTGVIDAIYNPLKTKLVLKAAELGIKSEGGLYMLVAQAVYASEIFLDTHYAADITERIYSKILKKKQNIVLIGMPSCGKSTVGAILAKRLGKRLVDTDERIVSEAKKPIPDIFSDDGEEAFRDLESSVIANISLQNGQIISTGGGAILRKSNIDNLKQNGVLFFIDRSPENLIATSDRPLSSSKEAVMARYNERYSIYTSAADVSVDGNPTPEEVAEKIIGGFYK